MPPSKVRVPRKLEEQCVNRFLFYLKDETNIIFHMRAYERRSVLLRSVKADDMLASLDVQFKNGLQGIVQDNVRQKMTEMLIQDLHNMADEAVKTMSGSRSYQILMERQTMERAASRVSGGRSPVSLDDSGMSSSPSFGGSSYSLTPRTKTTNASNVRCLPMFQLLELILNESIKELDFSKNREWLENEEMNEISRILWKLIGEKCTKLQRFVIPKELTYSSTLNSVIVNGNHLLQLTLKRNVPNNMFLNEIGKNCPQLQELDIAGAEVVTDFGMVCLLYTDPEQVFLKCWNRERTVGQARRSQKAFPHPHFDKQIPDQQEPQPRGSKSNNSNFLYLKQSFHESLRSDTGDTGDWERLPICFSLTKLRLENTKVKGDGASVVLESCPNIYSLGYLVFAAAGLKQVFGYEEKADTKFTEIFYRGPSDQKLSTIANCCPKLETMFLGSNNPRSLNSSVFAHWQHLSYLTLENILMDNILSCLELVGSQLRGLKIQCNGFDLSDIAVLCPVLKSLIIQKEAPNPTISTVRSIRTNALFSQLEHVEVSCATLSKNCFGFILKHAVRLISMKVLHVPKVNRNDFESWLSSNPLRYLKSLIIMKAPEFSLDLVLWLLQELEAVTEFGDLNQMEFARQPADVKKLVQEIKKKDWDISLVDNNKPLTLDVNQGDQPDEGDFSKLQSLHWFYLTPSDGHKQHEPDSGNSSFYSSQ